MSGTALGLGIGDLATEADIRAAMASDRCWEAGNTNLCNAVRAGAGNWTDVNATASSSFEWSNSIAGLGRDHGTGPEPHAHSFVDAPVTRGSFNALNARGTDGLSAMDRITRV